MGSALRRFLRSGSSRYSDDTDLVVKVKTGDKKGAGTDSNVKIAFIAENGAVSVDYTLDVLWRDDFEAGSLDDFEIKNLGEFGHVVGIELWRDEKGLFSDWYVDWVSVTRIKTGDFSIFPVHRWVQSNKKLRVYEFDAFLPQSAPDQEVRQQELEEKKRTYLPEIKIDGWLPQVKDLPSHEKFSKEVAWDIAALKTKLILHMKIQSVLTGKWKDYDEIFSFYNETLRKPIGSEIWKTDEAFGNQRLNNCNPTVIRRCKKLPEKFAVTEEMLKPFLNGLTIEKAIDAKRLYYVDYKVLQDQQCHAGHTIPAPLGLFFVNDEGKLLPVAIQLFQEPADDNPVFLPSDDPYTWLLAKMWFNNADCNFHQSCTHLGYTHLIMEPIAVATHRSLSPSHPMFRLLAPHFLYLMAINTKGIEVLICPGGWMDKCMVIGYDGVFKLIVRQLSNWRLDVQGILPRDLEERGVDDVEALPNYHYRDDALLIYNAIRNYVTEVVNNFYQSPEDIKADNELQSWGKTLSSPVNEGGTGVPGIPAGGNFQKAEDVVDLITAIIFMGSAAHAACNFSQYDDYGFPPNYPLFLQGEPIKDKRPRTADDINSTLPTKQLTMDTLLITRILSEKGTKCLGDFEVQYLFDPKSENAAENFRKELREIGLVIEKRNQTRPIPYTYLHPDCIPNSISI